LNVNQILFLLQGTGWTLVLSVIAALGGGFIGLLVALARTSAFAPIRLTSGAFVRVGQGIPLPVLMFLCYFGLAVAGIDLPALVAASISMIIFTAVYLGEIWRGCIEAVPKPQWEAAESLGLSRVQRMIDVVLPQALRIATPPSIGFMVQIVKSTSYSVVIGFLDLTQAGRIVSNAIFEPFLVFTMVGLIYFALCHPLSRLSRRFESRLRARGA
jgi:polar amino acid transport system permease protein